MEFADASLLARALTHSSFIAEFPGATDEANERLEFLGDAVLDLIVGQELMARFPDRREGPLTRMRASLVDDRALSEVARRLGLGAWLVMGRGEAERGGGDRASNLAGAFEALTGALFADAGYEAARAFALRVMSPELDAATEMGDAPAHPKSLLHETAMQRGLLPPAYEVLEKTGPDHAPQFTARVLIGGKPAGVGVGGSKLKAETQAAQAALNKMPPNRQTHR